MVNFADMLDNEDEAADVAPSPKPKAVTEEDIKTHGSVPPKVSRKVSPVIPGKISSSVVSESYDYFDAIRRAVRSIGNTPMPLRTTSIESDRMKAVVRQYEDQGVYTDRTQLLRVLLNYGLDELEREGEDSIIHKALMRIHVD